MNLNTLFCKSTSFYREIKYTINHKISTFYVYVFSYLYGIELMKKCVFIGLPHFHRKKNGFISIGRNCKFISNKNVNLIGINHKCIIAALRAESIIIIGSNCGFSGVSIGAAKKITFGDNVMVGANCVITDTDWHNMDPTKRHTPDSNPKEVSIGNNVFIGYGSIILKGVIIGENSVIGAGSVVSKSIPANAIAAGNPAKILKIHE